MDQERHDRRRIEFLLHTLMDAADRQQWSLAWACFADNVELDYGEPQQVTPAAIVQSWMELLPGFDTTKHHLTAIEVAVDGDRATSTSKFEATHQIEGAEGGDTWVLHGEYEHSYQLTPWGWKITRMRMQPGSSEGNQSLLQQARDRMARRMTVQS